MNHGKLLPAFAFLWCGLLVAEDQPKPSEPAAEEEVYTFKEIHDPNGIGKFYMGREIAHVMSYHGIPWLERAVALAPRDAGLRRRWNQARLARVERNLKRGATGRFQAWGQFREGLDLFEEVERDAPGLGTGPVRHATTRSPSALLSTSCSSAPRPRPGSSAALSRSSPTRLTTSVTWAACCWRGARA